MCGSELALAHFTASNQAAGQGLSRLSMTTNSDGNPKGYQSFIFEKSIRLMFLIDTGAVVSKKWPFCDKGGLRPSAFTQQPANSATFSRFGEHLRNLDLGLWLFALDIHNCERPTFHWSARWCEGQLFYRWLLDIQFAGGDLGQILDGCSFMVLTVHKLFVYSSIFKGRFCLLDNHFLLSWISQSSLPQAA